MNGRRRVGTLRRRVFWRTLLGTSVVAALALLMHAGLLLERQQAQQRQALENTLDVLMPNFAGAAWQINEGVMQTLLDSLAARPDVQWVRYTDEELQQTAPHPLEGAGACAVPIERGLAGLRVGAQALRGGVLTVCYAPPSWAAVLGSQGWQALPPLLLLLLAAALPTLMIRRTVLRPIEALTRAVRDEASVLDIELQRPAADRGDEVDRLLDELKQRTRRFLHERGMTELAFQAMREGMVITDEQGHVLRANPAAARLLLAEGGVSQGALLQTWVPSPEVLAVGEPQEFQNAQGRVIEVSGSRLEPEGDRGMRAYVFSDLTQRRQYEADTLQSHKMNALGTLSGGVAHDFNNLLMAIAGNAELLGVSENLSDDGRAMLAAIRHAARRGSGLTAQLLTFARKQPLKSVVLEVSEVCEEVVSLSRRTLGSTHRLQLSVQPGLRVRADATFLETALLNLLVNARDAQPEGGPIGLQAEALEVDGQAMVQLSVVNGGAAIEPEVLARMGEPFFTTKAKGKGTGLGLSMVMGFAEQSGGRLVMSSEPGCTRMALRLPREMEASVPAERAQALAAAPAGPARSLRVLVVDDDAAVLQVCTGLVASLGHWVTPVASAEAVERLLRDGQRWEVVICDVVLEDACGLDVRDIVLRHGASPAFVFVSGNVPSSLQGRLEAADALAVLTKPFDREALREALDRVAPGPIDR